MRIDRKARQEGIDWRTLASMPEFARQVGGVLYTRRTRRTTREEELLEAARQITNGDPLVAERHAKTLRRIQGVNDVLPGTRVNGGTLRENGQPGRAAKPSRRR